MKLTKEWITCIPYYAITGSLKEHIARLHDAENLTPPEYRNDLYVESCDDTLNVYYLRPETPDETRERMLCERASAQSAIANAEARLRKLYDEENPHE